MNRQAKYELKSLLPRARRVAAEILTPADDLSTQVGSPIGELMLPYLRIEYAVGVNIYARFGGWYSDVLLDPSKLPPGVGSAIGTPMRNPHRTRDEAEENAVNLLAMLIYNSSKPPPEKPQDNGERYFEFFGLWLTIPPELGDVIQQIVDTSGFDPANDPQFWLGRLDELKRKHLGDGDVTGEAFDALSEEAKRHILTVAAIVWSRLGLMRYPNDPEGPPT